MAVDDTTHLKKFDEELSNVTSYSNYNIVFFVSYTAMQCHRMKLSVFMTTINFYISSWPAAKSVCD